MQKQWNQTKEQDIQLNQVCSFCWYCATDVLVEEDVDAVRKSVHGF
jgi:hypothetical protein